MYNLKLTFSTLLSEIYFGYFAKAKRVEAKKQHN